MKMTGRSYFESIRFIKSKEVETDIVSDISSKLVEKEEWPELDMAIVNKLYEQALKSDRAIQYFNGRKITQDSIKKFKLGYSENQDMITIPVQNHEGLCVGFPVTIVSVTNLAISLRIEIVLVQTVVPLNVIVTVEVIGALAVP